MEHDRQEQSGLVLEVWVKGLVRQATFELRVEGHLAGLDVQLCARWRLGPAVVWYSGVLNPMIWAGVSSTVITMIVKRRVRLIVYTGNWQIALTLPDEILDPSTLHQIIRGVICSPRPLPSTFRAVLQRAQSQ